jgi:ATP-dependent DNA helicase RecQ
MKDQVDKLEDAGLEASQLNSALTTREHEENLEQIKTENSDFIFVTPERLTTPEFLAELRNQTIDFVVIDEAHCISEWGHDFRPAYLSLGLAVKTLGSPPVLALTATATPEVTADIEKQLDLGKLRVINTGIYRPNLHFEVKRVTNELEKHEELVRVLREHEGTGIIYCSTVKTVEALTEWLKDFDFNVEKYHGRMKASDRKQNQDAFMAGELKAIVATNAFGMGIDKPDIRFVVHYQMPGSLESYYQEAGRAGRDGETALCTLFYQLEDRRTQLFFIGRSGASEEKREKDKEKLERMMQYGQSAMCRWRLLHDYFNVEIEEERCGTCDNCVHPLEEQILISRPAQTAQINGHT